jgi:hypothetical protein
VGGLVGGSVKKGKMREMRGCYCCCWREIERNEEWLLILGGA